jgi:predicted MFS family arabinose efflux permease
VKPTATQIVLAYVTSISLLLTVFHRPLGLADYWEWAFMAVCVVAGIGLFVARKRQKAALAAAGSGEAPKPSRRIMWLSLILIMLTSLSSFTWLPYTGVAVSHTQLIMISATTFVLSITAFFIALRRSQRSNKSLAPTTGRRTERLKHKL